MQSSEEQRIKWIAGSIANYWRSHPNAADSIQGIGWWVSELQAESPALLQRAMDHLVQQGVARAKEGSDGTVAYSLRREAP